MTQKEQLRAALEAMAEALRPVVAEIEARPETTRDRYGDYMALISQLIERRAAPPLFYAACLIKAGANPEGVKAAAGLL